MDDEMIEKILGFDIKVLTDKGKERTIQFADIKATYGLDSTLSINTDINEDFNGCCKDKVTTIEFKLKCNNYSLVIE